MLMTTAISAVTLACGPRVEAASDLSALLAARKWTPMRRFFLTFCTVTAAVTMPAWAAAAGAAVPVGPGPQQHYTVQGQPKAGSCHYRHTVAKQPLPDVHCTPGARNPKVTQSTLATTICKTGYTATIRPPVSVTDKEKIANARSYNYRATLTQAEYDHYLPLELGGDPNDRRNLWVEPPSPGHATRQGVSNPKDGIETSLKAMVCHYVRLRSKHQGTATSYLPLTRAQQLMTSNWATAKALATKYLVHV